MEETRYCICCGENVPFSRLTRNQRIEFTCDFCGFPLESRPDVPMLEGGTSSPASYSEPERAGRDFPEEVRPQTRQKQNLGWVLVADDSTMTRELLERHLRERCIGGAVATYENGLKLVSGFKEMIGKRNPVDAVIADINMPRMDGITAGRVIRQIEIDEKIRPVPLIFFSAVKSNDRLRGLMQAVAPAFYVNKGGDNDPVDLAKRVEQLFYSVFGGSRSLPP